jgi:protein YIPF5/7
VHFGYIYGVALIGCVGMYFLLNMMAEGGINGARTTSVLGYCLLPMALLALAAALVSLRCVPTPASGTPSPR